MRKKIIQLPKPHISYSQIQLWKSNKDRYRKLYYDNNSAYKLNNSGLEYGKVVADALEKGIETGDLLTDAAMLLLPKFDMADKEILVEIKTKDGSFMVLGRPDSMNSVTNEFYEFKTGKGAWTANKAQKHPQMVFYAMLIYLKYKVVLDHAHLVWIETEDKDGVVTPTGKIEKFEVTFTLLDILNCIAETTKVAKEIELDFASYVPPPEEVF